MRHQQLLREYVEGRSEAAFADLVRGHVDFVYSAAMRILRDAHLAEDVTQSVFVALAQNARQLMNCPVLLGWLHRTVRNLSANAIRSEVRRRAREQEAVTMNQSLSAEPDPIWQEIAPCLDAALGELSDADRDALLLRYFEHKSAREMAETFRISEEAAQKRVTRAVERLREFLVKRGITVGANGLMVLIAANAVQAAPAGLAATISAAAALAGTALSTTATATVMTTLQKTVISTVITAALGTGVYQGAQNSKLRDKVQTLQHQQIAQHREPEEPTIRFAALQDETDSNQSNSELLKLRGEVARLRDAASRAMRAEAEVARLQSALASRGAAAAAAAPADTPSEALLAFLGEAVPPPANMDPAYSQEGLLNAVQQAVQMAGVSVKKFDMDTSEFPFLLGVVCESEDDFGKLKAQFKNLPNYEYQGGTGGHGSCAFSIVPFLSLPPESRQQISRRFSLRSQRFHAQVAGR